MCEYILRTDKCVEKAFSTVNMSCGRTNVKILFYCEYILRMDKCVEKAEQKLSGGLVSRDFSMHYLISRPFKMVKIKAFSDEFNKT